MILAKDVKPTEYHSYFHTYVKLTEGDLLDALDHDLNDILKQLEAIPKDKEHFAYDVGKWTIAQLIQHCVDTERVLQYRAFSIARGEKQMLNGFDENAYADALSSEQINFEALLEEMKAVRKSTIAMFSNMPESALENMGQASGHPLSSRAAGFIILGHWNHHMEILKTRYI